MVPQNNKRRRLALRTNRAANNNSHRQVSLALSQNISRNPAYMITRVFTWSNTLTSSAGGVMAQILDLNPSTSGDWNAVAALYDEWRLVGASIDFFCNQQNAVPSTASSWPIVCVYDNDDKNTALSGLPNGLTYPQNIRFSTIWDNQRFPKLTIQRPRQTALFTTTALPSAYPCSFKLYAGNVTASTLYMSYTLRVVCEMRGPT